MAEKIPRPKKHQAPTSDDLEVLFPDRTIIVRGEEVIVREYTFEQSLSLRPMTGPLLNSLCELMNTEIPDVDAIRDVLADHKDRTIALIAVSVEKEPAWVAGLNQDDGDHLMQAWWGVNGPFFMRSAINNLKRDRLLNELRQRTGSTPSAGSSQPATSGDKSGITH